MIFLAVMPLVRTLAVALTLPLLLPAANVTSIKLKTIGHGTSIVPISGHPATIVMFVATDCPMSMDYGQRVARLEQDFAARGVRVLIVDSNRNETDAQVEKVRKDLGIASRIYRDPSASVAEQLAVIVTPTAVVLDSAGAIRYKGAIDDSRDPSRIKNHFVEAAIDAVLTGRAVQVPQTRVLGCSIKR